MNVAIDRTGQRYGQWFVLGRAVGSPLRWLCRCDCGTIKSVAPNSLARGDTESCGCAAFTATGERQKTHGMAARGSRHPLYSTWQHMLRRCYSDYVPEYRYYGARGIRVCERWRVSFADFVKDMGPRPSALHSIDRYPDKNGNYEPGNCRWATKKEQSRNTRTNNIVEFGGRRMALAEAIEASGLRTSTVSMRLVRGWPVHAALSLPLGTKYGHR